jgi:Salmonella virulence plasmid 65kDa B protein
MGIEHPRCRERHQQRHSGLFRRGRRLPSLGNGGPRSDAAVPGRRHAVPPRTEGTFARIQHRLSEQDSYWEVRSRNGLTSLYGHRAARGTDSAVVRNPDDTLRGFSWSLTETTDPFGNRIEYLYEREPVAEDGPRRWDQIYLKTIRYADHGPKDAPQFLVTVDFVYDPRSDPFSSYRAGFEIRTTRRCARIEIRTHANTTQLTRVYRLIYQDELQSSAAPTNGVSLLQRIEVEGVEDEAREALPPLDFAYTGFDPSRRAYRPLSAIGDAVPERSLTHPDFELADLFSRGLPDVVQIGDVNRYWRNLGEGRFDVSRSLDDLPAGVRLGVPAADDEDLDDLGEISFVQSKVAAPPPDPQVQVERDRAERQRRFFAGQPDGL